MNQAHSTDRRQWIVSLALIAFWAVWIGRQFLGHWGSDLAALYVAARLIAMDQAHLIYAHAPGYFGGTPPEWQALATELGLRGLVYPYLYPPLWAKLAAPLASNMTPQAFFDLFGIIHAACLAGSLYLGARIAQRLGTAPLLYLAITLPALSLTAPALLAALFNQPSAAITFLTLLAVERYQAGRGTQSGAALALAAAIKLTPAAFILIFLAGRGKRAAATFLVIGSALAVACVALTPMLTRDFAAILSDVSAYAGLGRANASTVTLLYTIEIWRGAAAPIPPEATGFLLGPKAAPIPHWIPLVTRSALIGAVIGSVWLTRHLRRSVRAVAIALLISLAIPLFGPLGWLHYYITPLLLAPALLTLLRGTLRRIAAALAWLLLIVTNLPQLPRILPALETDIASHAALTTLAWLGFATLCALWIARFRVD